MKVNLLLSSAGRRAGLLECFRQSLSALQLDGQIIAIETTPYSAAAQLADKFHIVPKCTDSQFIPEVLKICKKENIRLIVPTIDTELPAYASARESFERAGIAVAVSSAEAVAICRDKVLTHEWLMEQDLPAPRQARLEEVLSGKSELSFPLVVKPAAGSGSIGVRVVGSSMELKTLANCSNGLIVQDQAQGMEYTVNVFVNRDGDCVCAVPHARLEIRAGEVSKGMTTKNRDLMRLAETVAERIPGAYGALNVQCFRNSSGEIKIIELNARFGGGYPLTHHAGAPITQWLLEDVTGKPSRPYFEDWQDGMVMLRYDEAVYKSQSSMGYV